MKAIVTKSQIKVLEVIYRATDCCNQVFDYAMLHHTQEKVAESMPLLVTFINGCELVDGDGFRAESGRTGKGFRLTNAGYECLTKHDKDRFPPDKKHRRFYQTESEVRDE